MIIIIIIEGTGIIMMIEVVEEEVMIEAGEGKGDQGLGQDPEKKNDRGLG